MLGSGGSGAEGAQGAPESRLQAQAARIRAACLLPNSLLAPKPVACSSGGGSWAVSARG